MGSAVVVMTLGAEYDVTRAAGMRARLAKIDGVDFVDFDYTNNKLTVRFNPDRARPSELKAIATREKKHRVALVQGLPVGAGASLQERRFTAIGAIGAMKSSTFERQQAHDVK